MYIVFHLFTGILRLSSDFSTLSALISMKLNSTFQDIICRKSLFTVIATCGTGSELPFSGVILYAQ